MELGLVNMDPVPKCVASSETHAHASMLVILFAVEHFLKTGIIQAKVSCTLKEKEWNKPAYPCNGQYLDRKGFNPTKNGQSKSGTLTPAEHCPAPPAVSDHWRSPPIVGCVALESRCSFRSINISVKITSSV